MIIGNNNPNKFKENNDFLNKESEVFNRKRDNYKENSENIKTNNIFVKDIKNQQYSNVNSKNDMYDKALAMLNERLRQGLISIDEFNRQCNELAKKRQK